jgi:polygalacturonase
MTMNSQIRTDSPAIDRTGKRDATAQLQALIDEAARTQKEVVFSPGIYKIHGLFVPSCSRIQFEEGAQLTASLADEDYSLIPTRVAGIDMDFYPALLNVRDAHDVTLSGPGVIDGNGPYWWAKYWGKDGRGGIRSLYDKAGLRWAADYDCLRPRNLLVQHSSRVIIEGMILRNSGFWNCHILFSNEVTIRGISVDSCAGGSPSTDGIDIDSSHHVVVERCVIDCDDDDIAIKSGRDYDGYKDHECSSDIEIHHCTIKRGYGITLGSEVSGGIENIHIHDIAFEGSSCGFRIKSSAPRKGYIRHVHLAHLQMKSVCYLFHLFLDWNPAYCHCELPEGYQGEIKPTYQALLKSIPSSVRKTQVSDIVIEDVQSVNDPNYSGISRIFTIQGYSDEPIRNLVFRDMVIKAKEYGYLSDVENIQFENCSLHYDRRRDPRNDTFDNR